MAHALLNTTVLGSVIVAVVAIVVVKFASLLYFRFKYKRLLKGFTEHPNGVPFFGHNDAYNKGFNGVERDFTAIYENGETALQVWMGPFRPGVVVYHPDNMKAVLATMEPKEEVAYGFFEPWLGQGLLTSTGKKWARNRRLLTPGFHFDILKPYIKTHWDSAKKLEAKLRRLCDNDKESSIELGSLLGQATVESLMKCIMGLEYDIQGQSGRNPYLDGVKTMMNAVQSRFSNLLHSFDLIYYMTSNGIKYKKDLKFLHDFTMNVVRERREKIADISENGRGDKKRQLAFLDILLTAKDADGKGLTDLEIRNEVDTFMFEGHDTTQSGMTWILYCLAEFPEHQEKCRQEIDGILNEKGTDLIEWDDMAQMMYLTKTIKEVMRRYPVVPWVARTVKLADLKLPDGRVIPKGTAVFTHIHGCHYNPAVWKDPHKFDPERFDPKNSRGRDSHAYVIFAAGPRNCIGQRFAMDEMRTMTALLLRHFRFRVDPSKPVKPKNYGLLRSDTGVHLFVEPRLNEPI